ncbi:MAG: zinc metalloprotease [Gaiella sp.]
MRTEKDTVRYSGSTEVGQKTPGKPVAGTIDVYFHVITTTNGAGAVSTATIAAQIAVLNDSFAGLRGGADTGFRFRLAAADMTANNAWFAQETFEDEVAMKAALKDGGPSDLNIYTTGGGGYLGWAYYPSIVASRQYAVLDGVVVHFGSLPGGRPPYDLGLTVTHEVGHWLGLAHTFEQGCIGHGDSVDDTPYMSEPTAGCPAAKDTCTRGVGLDPIHNYMDYSDDACFEEFTRGQAERAQKQFAHWRLKRS